MRPWMFLVPGIAILLVVAIPLAQKFISNDTTNQPTDGSTAVTVTTAGKNAFGSLAGATATLQNSGGTGREVALSPGEGLDETSADASAGDVTEPSLAPIAVDYPFVQYAYGGGTFSVPSLPVLRRNADVAAPDIARQLSVGGLLDLGSFTGLDLQQATLRTDDGYDVSVDYQNGLVSLYRSSGDGGIRVLEAAPDALPGDAGSGSVREDAELIRAARAFLEDHGIAADAYGDPVVRRDWYETAVAMRDVEVYAPSSGSVVFPWTIDGEDVVDGSGIPMGLTVDVATDDLTVIGVSNLASLRFTSSTYDLVTDTAVLTAAAEQGGFYGGGEALPEQEVVTVTLGTPTVGYTQSYLSLEGESGEVLVPALIFPVTEVPDAASELYIPNAVVVPFVAEVLESSFVISTGTGSGSDGVEVIDVDPAVPTKIEE